MGNCEDLRDSEYDRGTGCGKTARPGLCGGPPLTEAPLLPCEAKKEESAYE